MDAQIIDKRNINQEWKTERTKANVSLGEFRVLLPRDGIPPIDKPKFWTANEADGKFFDHEPVITLTLNGETKAYPLSILMFHEIVNDEVGGNPVSVTYCPLCNAAIVFDRNLQYDGETYLLDFGVSGMLRKSDLVMWDRQTETWWQQFTGEALVGKLAGARLDLLPSALISYEDFIESYPGGYILSKETGFGRQEEMYGTNPYENYDDIANDKPFLFFEEIDSRLPAMERVINVNSGDINRVYPLTLIQKEGVINDTVGNKNIVLFHQFGTKSVMGNKDIQDAKDIGAVTVFSSILDGELLTFTKTRNNFTDNETGSVWSLTGKCIEGKLKGKELKPEMHGNHFAFAWFAFRPDSQIYKPEKP